MSGEQQALQGAAAIAANGRVDRNVMHSFTDEDGKRWTACAECNRGGNGNDKDKCACGWQCTKLNGLGCFLGTAIVGEPKAQPKLTRSQERYRRFLEYGDGFDSFLGFCRWDSAPERSWNCGA